MLSNHFQNGIETAKLVWSRLPSSDDSGTEEHERIMNDIGGAQSLDYEIIENYAYREAQAKRSKLFNWYYAILKWLIALLIGVDIWKHWLSWRRACTGQRRSTCSHWCLYCISSWSRRVYKISFQFIIATPV